MFSFNNGRHDWQVSAENRAKVSYVALEMFFYEPGFRMLTSYCRGSPQRRTWSLCECSYIHFLFPRTSGHNLKAVPGEAGCVVLPENVRHMLTIMSSPAYISDVEDTLKTERKKK